MTKTSKKSKKVLSSEDIALEAISMTQQGYSYAEVAKSLNVEVSKVYNPSSAVASIILPLS